MNVDNYQPEVAGDVVSDEALDCVGVDIPAKFDDSKLNSGRIIRLFFHPDPFYTLLRSI